jgi:hypothetical protein
VAQRRADRLLGQSAPVWVRAEAVREVLERATSMQDFQVLLQQKHGIRVKTSTGAEGNPHGLLFARSGSETFLAGSSIDRQFSLQKVLQQLAENRRLADAYRAAEYQRAQQAARQAQRPTPPTPRERGG